MPSLCKNKECSKYASYNFTGEKQRKYCKTHAEHGMVIVKIDGRICIHKDHEGQNKIPRASFNFPNIPRPIYCKIHSEIGMINLSNKNSMCTVCKEKQPSYGLEGQKASHCSKCSKGIPNLVDVISNLCIEKDCKKHANFGVKGEKPKYCKTHSKDEMSDIKNKKCEKCDKQATFGINKPTHCKTHKSDKMIDQKHDAERCRDCNKRATYGIEFLKPTHCVIHKLDDMTDVKSKKCLTCNLQPTYNYKNEKLPIYCSNCSLDNMINVKHPRCKSCQLFIVNSKTSLCSYCKPESTIRQKTKEMTVVCHLQEKGLEFIHNKSVGFVCGGYRPDIKIDALTHLVIVEVDENQHSQYEQSCEIARMFNIYQAEGLDCVFLRYNPDVFKVNGKTKIIQTQTRLKVLVKEIEKHMEKPPKENLAVYKLFYNNTTGNHVEKHEIVECYEVLLDLIKKPDNHVDN